MILVEKPSRFARDLAVQLTGHELLRGRVIELVPVDAPTYFTGPSPSAELMRQILGAVSQFEKAALVGKLCYARDRKRGETGRCEGRRPIDSVDVAQARRLARKSPKSGKARSLRAIAGELALLGYSAPPASPTMPGASPMCPGDDR